MQSDTRPPSDQQRQAREKQIIARIDRRRNPDSLSNRLDSLYASLPHRLDLLYLTLALDHYRRDDEACRDHWDRHVNLRFDTRSGKDPRRVLADDFFDDGKFDYRYWQRTWAMREKARAIIEGRRKWPDELRVWKTWRELQWLHGHAQREPAWLAHEDASPPTRCGSIKSNLTARRRERRAAIRRARR